MKKKKTKQNTKILKNKKGDFFDLIKNHLLKS